MPCGKVFVVSFGLIPLRVKPSEISYIHSSINISIHLINQPSISYPIYQFLPPFTHLSLPFTHSSSISFFVHPPYPTSTPSILPLALLSLSHFLPPPLPPSHLFLLLPLHPPFPSLHALPSSLLPPPSLPPSIPPYLSLSISLSPSIPYLLPSYPLPPSPLPSPPSLDLFFSVSL